MAYRTRSILKAALWGGLVAGAVDIIYACVFSYLRSGVTPDGVLKFVASGLIGIEGARAGGSAAAALGLFLHFLIAVIAAALYVLASVRLPVLREKAVAAGAVFGVLMYLAMNYVVAPLSLAPHKLPGLTLAMYTGVLVHILFGVIIAVAARRAIGRGSA